VTPTETKPITSPKSSHRPPERAVLEADVGVAGEHGRRVLARVVQERGADHLRVRVRVANALPARDDDERRPGELAKPLGDRLDVPCGIPRAERTPDRRNTRDGACDQERLAPRRPVELVPRLDERDREARTDRQQDDRQLEHDDLRGQPRPARHRSEIVAPVASRSLAANMDKTSTKV
jgi:hypothetical protein